MFYLITLHKFRGKAVDPQEKEWSNIKMMEKQRSQ